MALTDTRLRTLKPRGRAECLVADGNGLYIRIRKKQSDVSRIRLAAEVSWEVARKVADLIMPLKTQ